MTSSWIIVFGATPDLSLAEFHALFPSQSFQKLSAPSILVKNSELDPLALCDIAGGVVKVARVINKTDSITPEKMADLLLAHHQSEGSIVFGVSRYDGERVTTRFLHDMKQYLEEKNQPSRFVEGKSGELSSVVIEKQHVQELIIAKGEEGLIIGQTAAVQDFESWGKRDYGRPYADPKSGMLPPKVARMIVNIALKNSEIFQGKPVGAFTILDPFCGMGTILAEALLRGCSVFGSDQSKNVVARAQKNLDWFASAYRIDPLHATLFVNDATHVSEKLSLQSVDAIVTEPYMGPAFGGNYPIPKSDQSDQLEKIRNTIKGLEKLYIGCLRDWIKVLKPQGKVVIAIPKYVFGGRIYSVKKVVDNCENLGYSKLLGPIEYSRPQAVVKREFFVFVKN